MDSVTDLLAVSGLQELAPVLPPKASWVTTSDGKCGWECWPEFELNLSASSVAEACIRPPPPAAVDRLIAVSAERGGSVRLVVDMPESPPRASIVAWKAKVRVIGAAVGSSVPLPDDVIPGDEFELPGFAPDGEPFTGADQVQYFTALSIATGGGPPVSPPENLVAVEVPGLRSSVQYRIKLAAGNAGGYADYGSVESPLVNTVAAVAPGPAVGLAANPLSGGLSSMSFGLGVRPGGAPIEQVRVCVAAASGASDPPLNGSILSWPGAELARPVGPCERVLIFGSRSALDPGSASVSEPLAPAVHLSDEPIQFE